MRRLRVTAAALAILTALTDWLLALDPGIHGSVVVSAAIAAACLAAFTPFEALEPPARKLVALACAAFVLAIGGALALAVGTGGERAPVAMLAALTAGGVGMAAWAFTIRNRRRRSSWGNYYDN